MKRTLLYMVLIAALIIAVALVVQSTRAAETLGTLRSVRWHAMAGENVKVTGTAQIDTTFVDSSVVKNLQSVSTDFSLSSYLTNTDSQTVTATIPAGDTSRTQVYTMNSDFIPGGLVTAMRLPYATRQLGYFSIPVGPPDLSSSIPSETDQPSRVWTEGNLLIIQPAPSNKDKFLLFYRSLPTKPIHVDSSIGIDEPLRSMVVVLTQVEQ